MTKKALSLLVLAAAWIAPGRSQDDNLSLTSRVNILGIDSLHKPEGYEHRDAQFGLPDAAGTTITAPLLSVAATLCTLKQVDASQFAIKPFILMVERGGCSFVRKVGNGQKLGAAAVVIADNLCVCGRSECEGQYPCQQNAPIMVDNGFGQVTIPSVLLFKEDADAIKQALTSQQTIQMELAYNSPAQETKQVVTYDLWTTPTNALTKMNHENFVNTVVALQDSQAHFTPHMFLFDGVVAGCRGASGKEVGSQACLDDCTNGGRYCAPTGVVNSAQGGVRGADLVVESLRRICIWQLYGASGNNGIGMEWWQYVAAFSDTCENENTISRTFAQPKCIGDAMTQAGVDADRVNQCMQDAGGTADDVPNALLDGTIADEREVGVVSLPTVFVNGAHLRDFMGLRAFDAICDAFDASSKPTICQACRHCDGGTRRGCLKTGHCPNNPVQNQANKAQNAQQAKAAEKQDVQLEKAKEVDVHVEMEKMEGMEAGEDEQAAGSP